MGTPCAYCKGSRTRVTSTQHTNGFPVERSYKCADCGGTFTGHETVIRCEPLPAGHPLAKRPRRRHRIGRPPKAPEHRLRGVKLRLRPDVESALKKASRSAGGSIDDFLRGQLLG